MLKNHFLKLFVATVLCMLGIGHISAQQSIRLTTTKATKGNSNTKKFNIEICVNTPREVTIDWGDGKVETVTIETTDPETETTKLRRHFQDGKKEHIVSITGDGVTCLKVNGQKLKNIDLSNSNDLLSLSITSEPAVQELNASACTKLQKLVCSNNGLTRLSLPNGLTYLDCSNNALGITSIPDLQTGMAKENFIYAPQRAHDINSTLIKGFVADLSTFTNRKGVATEAQQTEFEWYDTDGVELSTTAYHENEGIFTFNTQPGTPIYCKYSTPAFPGIEFQTSPITLTQSAVAYRFGYSYGTPSAKGSEKAGGKLWYAAGPVFTDKELASFKNDKIAGIRVYVHQAYPQSKVFVRAGLSQTKGNLAEKITDLNAGWNEIMFDTPVEIPQDSLLAAYFIRTENKTDVVLAGDQSIRNVNHLWEMIQDRQEAPEPGALFYETSWINSSKDLPAAPVQVLLQGEQSHFENRITVIGFYPSFYAPINAAGASEFPVLLANRGLNKIEKIEVNYSIDQGQTTTVELPVNLEPYSQQTIDGDFLKMTIPYPDTKRHTLALELAKVNGTAGNIMNAKWSQLTQGYHKDKAFPRTPLVETLMSEGDPFAANAEKNITSLLNSKAWAGHNIVRMDYHLGIGDRQDTYELPEIVFNSSVGRLAIFNDEEGYTKEQETVIPSIMVDRDIMTSYATYLYKGSPFLPVLDNNSMAQLLITDAIASPGFAELSIVQNKPDTRGATQFEVSGVISQDVEFDNLNITVLLVEDGLVGKQTMYDAFLQEIVENENFVHAPIARSFITHPQGDALTVEDNGTYTYKSPNVFLDGMNVNKCKVVAFIHKNTEHNKLGNMVLNTTASNIDPDKIQSSSAIDRVENTHIDCTIVSGKLVVKGNVQSVELYDIQGHKTATQNLPNGIYMARITDGNGAIHFKKLMCR